jgi:hypothetical protein
VIVCEEPEEVDDWVETLVCQEVSDSEAEAQAKFLSDGIYDLGIVKSMRKGEGLFLMVSSLPLLSNTWMVTVFPKREFPPVETELPCKLVLSFHAFV